MRLLVIGIGIHVRFLFWCNILYWSVTVGLDSIPQGRRVACGRIICDTNNSEEENSNCCLVLCAAVSQECICEYRYRRSVLFRFVPFRSVLFRSDLFRSVLFCSGISLSGRCYAAAAAPVVAFLGPRHMRDAASNLESLTQSLTHGLCTSKGSVESSRHKCPFPFRFHQSALHRSTYVPIPQSRHPATTIDAHDAGYRNEHAVITIGNGLECFVLKAYWCGAATPVETDVHNILVPESGQLHNQRSMTAVNLLMHIRMREGFILRRSML